MSEAVRDYTPWVAPSITPGDDAGEPEQLSAEALEAVLDQARREGRAEGRAEGLALGLKEGREEVRKRLQRLDGLHAAFDRPLAQVDEQVQRRLAELSLALAAQVTRVEFSQRPEALLPVVRDAVAALPPSREPPRLHLNPADAKLLRELLAEAGIGADWQLVDDGGVAAGGVVVRCAFTEVDATLETRLAAMAEGFRAQLEEALGP